MPLDIAKAASKIAGRFKVSGDDKSSDDPGPDDAAKDKPGDDRNEAARAALAAIKAGDESAFAEAICRIAESDKGY